MIKRLKFVSHNIDDIGVIASMANLIELDLTDNKIASVSSLGDLKKLKVLNLSKNKVQSLRGIEKLKALEVLFLQGNQLQDYAKDVRPYLSQLPRLRAVHMQNPDRTDANLLCKEAAVYPRQLFKDMPKLQVCDGERISLRETARLDLLEELCQCEPQVEIPAFEPWEFGEDTYSNNVKLIAKDARAHFERTLQECAALVEQAEAH